MALLREDEQCRQAAALQFCARGGEPGVMFGLLEAQCDGAAGSRGCGDLVHHATSQMSSIVSM